MKFMESTIFFDKTPLHIASERGHLDIVKFLVEQDGIDINIKDIINQSIIDEIFNIFIFIIFISRNFWNSQLYLIRHHYIMHQKIFILILSNFLLSKMELISTSKILSINQLLITFSIFLYLFNSSHEISGIHNYI